MACLQRGCIKQESLTKKLCRPQAGWDTNMQAASPLCPTCLRPLLKSYMPVKNFKFQLFLISLLTLVSCSKETSVEERVVFWKSELYKIIPTGTPQEEALNKLKEIDSEAFVNLLSGNISSKLESIESNGIPCKDWVLVATTEIQDNAVIKHSISSTGRCL